TGGHVLLPAEVIDEKQATVRLELQRGFVETQHLVEAEFEHPRSQLTAHLDSGSLRQLPAAVVRWQLPIDWHVMDRVVEADHLAVHVERAWHEDGRAEEARRCFGDGCLPVSGRAVQEDRLSRAERGCEMVQDGVGENEMDACMVQTRRDP